MDNPLPAAPSIPPAKPTTGFWLGLLGLGLIFLAGCFMIGVLLIGAEPPRSMDGGGASELFVFKITLYVCVYSCLAGGALLMLRAFRKLNNA